MVLRTAYERNSNPQLWDETKKDKWGLGMKLNCGSFALDVSTWYLPYSIEEDDDEFEGADYPFDYHINNGEYTIAEREHFIARSLEAGVSPNVIKNQLLKKDFDFILKTCSWIEPITKDQIFEKPNKVIAYRVSLTEDEENGIDSDFHFCVLIDGVWWEKNGSGPIHEHVGNIEDPWVVSSPFYHPQTWAYDSDICYARFKN